ncbi:hypothetical protein CALCODRAFT_484950 [Calocera cornea HHB12733]|uniref:Carbohydrate-binding module family 19 domain-containing protein n=1 Tax=Calocera cornea HHB12733 TaxID=1353952 RepID=A0A165EN61_9BASI|nr:hypothetical protein CALCODRAFT_484950 [Calocera cornea HHB12733]
MRSLIVLVLVSLFAIAVAGPQRPMSCGNQGLLKKPKPPRLGPGCDPSQSKGFKSSHNCQGSNYLCVINGVATCYEGKAALKKLNAENGECFM